MMQNLKLLIFMLALLSGSLIFFQSCLAADKKKTLKVGYVILILSVPVIGLTVGNKNIFYLFLALIPLFSLGNVKKLANIYALMLTQFPALGDNYYLGSLYLGVYSGIYAFNAGAIVALMFAKWDKRPNIWRIDLAFWIIFFIYLGFSARGLPVDGVLRQILQALFNLVPGYYIMSRALTTREAANEAALFFILGALSNAVIASYEAVHHWPLYERFYSALNVPLPNGLTASLSIRAGLMRAQGSVANPATLSLLTGYGVIGCLALKNSFSQVGRALIIAVLVLGMVASQSRGGWVACIAGLILYWFYMGRTRVTLAFAAAGTAAWAAIAFLLPENGSIGQAVGRSGHGEETAIYRSDLLRRGIEEVGGHPVFGQTMDQLQISMNDLRQGQHIIDFVNTHLFVALTLGLFGLAAWLAAWVLAMATAWNARGDRPPFVANPPVALPFAMLGATFVALAFTSTIDRMLPFTTMSLGLVSAYISLNRIRAPIRNAGGGANLAPAPRLVFHGASTPREGAI